MKRSASCGLKIALLIKPYFSRDMGMYLRVEDGCLLWLGRIFFDSLDIDRSLHSNSAGNASATAMDNRYSTNKTAT